MSWKQLVVGLCALACAHTSWAQAADAPVEKVPVVAAAQPAGAEMVFIDVHGEVDAVMAATFKRRFDEAIDGGARVVVLDMDTWGGGLHAAYDMADYIIKAPETVTTIAYVSEKAISAGAMISLACNGLAMCKNTRIGDCEAIMVTGDGIQSAPEKIKSPLREDFRNYAKRGGFPEALAIAMVDKGHEVMRVVLAPEDADLSTDAGRKAAREAATVVYEQSDRLEQWPLEKQDRILEKRTEVREGELLTMVHDRAFEYGFARWVVTDRDELVELLKKEYGADLQVREIVETGWEKLIGFLTGPMHGFLMFIGVLGVMIEFYHPGLIVPGVVGLLCLALAFFGSHLLGAVDVIDVILLVAGVGLLVVELVVLPGFGVAGVLGMLCIMAGLFFSFQSFPIFPEHGFEPWQAAQLKANLRWFGAGLAGLIICFSIIVRYLPGSLLLRGLVITDTQRVEDGYSVASASRIALLGKHGRAVTALRPAGKIEVGDDLVDAMAEGTFIERDQRVEIIETDENRVVVRPVSSEETA